MTSSGSDSDQPATKRQKVQEELSCDEEESDQLDSDDEDSEEEPEPNADNPFLSLPVEIMDQIFSCLPLRDPASRVAFIKTSADLHRRYRLRFLVEHFKDPFHKEQVFCVKNTETGSAGWHPFAVIGATEQTRDDQQGEAGVVLRYIEFDLTEYYPELSTRDYLPLQLTDYSVEIDNYGCWERVQRDPGREMVVEWEEIRGRMVRADPELLKQRFVCPECEGTREVEYGTASVGRRWPEMSRNTSFQFDGPCPRCSIDREEAGEWNDRMVELKMEELMEDREVGEPY